MSGPSQQVCALLGDLQEAKSILMTLHRPKVSDFFFQLP